MKISTKPINYHQLTLVVLILVTALANAQLQQPFSPRFNEAVNGDFTIIANNMISTTSTGNYTGGSDNHGLSNLVYVDIDSDITTFNSSNANFVNPEPGEGCLILKKVYLYWAASDGEPGDLSSDNQPAWNFNEVKLMLPTETSYSTITATGSEIIYRGRDTHFSNEPYICVKDITASVNALASPYGTYQVANVEGKEGFLSDHDGTPVGVSGGWQIVFIYESPALPMKNITLFDGYAHVNGSGGYDIEFNGFQTVPAPQNVNANVLIGALEGDQGLGGDRLQIENTSNTFVDLSTSPTSPIRTSSNFFNSRITIDNSDFTDRNPASTNTLGFDAAIFQLSNPGNSIIGNDQTSATVRLTSNLEIYGLYLLGLSVDVWEPNLGPIHLTLNTPPGNKNPGDTLEASFSIENKGNDNAKSLEITTTLPPQVTLANPVIPGLPAGITNDFGVLGPNVLRFFVPDGVADAGASAVDVTFDIEIQDECYFLETSCDLDFELQLEATYTGDQNPVEQSNVSSANLDACGVGILDPVIVNVNEPTVTINAPDSQSESSCTYANQAELDNVFTAWLNQFNTSGNCTSGQFDQSYVAPNLCGGSVSVTYEVTNLCNPTSETRTFTVTAPAAITYNNPADEDVESCDFVDQDAVDTAFTNWVNAQSTAIAQAGGCTPSLS
ncbi:hypothetical protein VOI54_14280, partial [Tamlana sp. 2201CG12-4]|nr:hypothetical protein [Tamlana sp. 2201CG12-4]